MNNSQNYISLSDGYLTLDTCRFGFLSAAVSRGMLINIGGITQLKIPANASYTGHGDSVLGVHNDGTIYLASGGVSPGGKAGGDLDGYYPNPSVIAINGVKISGIPSLGQTIVATSATTGSWQTVNSFTAGGDLRGTNTNQIVIAINGASVPIGSGLTIGNTLQVIDSSSLGYGPIDLAGGNNVVIGKLPAANIPALIGDVIGTIDATQVIAINGTTVQPLPVANTLLVATSTTSSVWSQIFDGYVSPTAAIQGTKIVPNFGNQNIITNGTLSVSSITDTGLGLGIVHSSSGGLFSSSLIVDADVSATAAIAGTKINPNFGSQNILTTGTLNVGSATATSITDSTLGFGIVHSSSGGLFSSSLIVNADVSATAAIDGTKISPNFGSQNVITTGTIGAGAATFSSMKDTAMGVGVVISDSSGNLTSSATIPVPLLPSLAGDVTGPYNATIVSKISGTAPVNVVNSTLSFGATPSTAGNLRFSNNFSITGRNVGNTANANLVAYDASNNMSLGDATNVSIAVLNSSTQTQIFGANNQVVINSSAIQNKIGTTSVLSQGLNSSDFISLGAIPSTIGTIRFANNSQIAIRNAANTADINMAIMDTANSMQFGGTNTLTTLTSGTQTALVGSTSSIIINSSAVVLNQNNFQFANGTSTAPLFSHQTTGGTTGSTFTIQAQNATGASSTGGNLILQSGSGTSLSGFLRHNVASTVVLQQSLNTGSDFISFGATPSSVGAVRLTNNQQIAGRNVGNTADINLIFLDASNNITVGGTNSISLLTAAAQVQVQVASNQIIVNSSSIQNKYAGNTVLYQGQSSSDLIAFGAAPATSGTIRLSNNQPIFARNLGNTANATLLAYDASNNLSIGDATNVSLATLSSSTQTQIIGSSGALTVNSTAVVVGSTNLQFTLGISNPVIAPQTNASNSITGTPLTIQGQNATGASTIGGAVILKAGSGTAANGTIVFENAVGAIRAYVNDVSFAVNAGFGITKTYVTTSAYTVSATDFHVQVNTSGTAVGTNISMAPSPYDGQTVIISDVGGAMASKPIGIIGNGHNVAVIGGSAGGSLTTGISTNYQSLRFIFNSSVNIWVQW